MNNGATGARGALPYPRNPSVTKLSPKNDVPEAIS